MPHVALERVTVRYRRGAPPALEDFSLALDPGIIGLVGPNGAGKTSLLKLLLGAMLPSAGTATIDGEPPEAFRRKNGIGYIPEQPSFPPYLTVGEFLSGLRSIAGDAGPAAAGGTLGTAFGLEALSGSPLGQLSLGQKRRVELAAALIGDPDVVLLDEPTNGLDPLAVAALRGAILDSRRDDRLILVSSHHLDELQRMVDRVVVVDHGRLVGTWTAEEVHDLSGSFHDLFLQLVSPDER